MDSASNIDAALQDVPTGRDTSAKQAQATKPATSIVNSLGTDSVDGDEEEAGLYDFAEELRTEKQPVEPWFLEGSRLRRIYILWLNKRLAMCRKNILERQQPSDRDMEELGKIFHLQGTGKTPTKRFRCPKY